MTDTDQRGKPPLSPIATAGFPARARPDDQELGKIAAALGPLGSPVRLRILRSLTHERAIEEVAAEVDITRQAARKHLDKLVRLGVVERRHPQGRALTYVINPHILFGIYEEFERLGSLARETPEDSIARTWMAPNGQAPPLQIEGQAIIMMRGFGAGRVIRLSDWRPQSLIGREDSCEICLPYDPYVSSRHAELRFGESIVLADLHSTNGTWHNLRKLERGSEIALRHGDLFGVGKTQFLYWERHR